MWLYSLEHSMTGEHFQLFEFNFQFCLFFALQILGTWSFLTSAGDVLLDWWQEMRIEPATQLTLSLYDVCNHWLNLWLFSFRSSHSNQILLDWSFYAVNVCWSFFYYHWKWLQGLVRVSNNMRCLVRRAVSVFSLGLETFQRCPAFLPLKPLIVKPCNCDWTATGRNRITSKVCRRELQVLV